MSEKQARETEYQQWLRHKKAEYGMGVLDIMSRAFFVFPIVMVMAYFEFDSMPIALVAAALAVVAVAGLSYVFVRWAVNGERWHPISEEEFNRITQMYMGNDE